MTDADLAFDGLLATLNEAIAEALGYAEEDAGVARRLTLLLAYATGRASKVSGVDLEALLAAGREHEDA